MKRKLKTSMLSLCILYFLANGIAQAQADKKQPGIMDPNLKDYPVHYNKIKAGGLSIFYRESGPSDAPVILLMHGYPTSSFMFRNLIPLLSRQYHVVAPDLPGFGFSEAPLRTNYNYSFDAFSKTMQAFIDSMGLKRFALYIFDYGAPVGLRLAMANPEKITAIITQNGNAYEEGLSKGWNPVQQYWERPTQANRDNLKQFLNFQATSFQYREGVTDQSLIAPETIELDQHFLDRPENVEIQLDLLKDYANNVKLYSAFHLYFKKYQPRLLATWGNRDPYFLPAGALAYKKDLPEAIVKFYNTGHFVLETNCSDIAADILDFMSKNPK